MEPNEQDETQAGNDRVEDLSESYTSMPMLMELLKCGLVEPHQRQFKEKKAGLLPVMKHLGRKPVVISRPIVQGKNQPQDCSSYPSAMTSASYGRFRYAEGATRRT